jgi:hypothetical protein
MKNRPAGIWSVLLFALFSACVWALTWHVSATRDIWWQLANGRYILEIRRLVDSDVFTFTVNGLPYLDKYWFFEVVAFLLYRQWGWSGLVALRILLVQGCLVSTVLSVRRNPRWLLLLLAMPALILLDLRCLLRGYWLSLIILPVHLRLSQESLGAGACVQWRKFALLWMVQALWSNLHSEFPWGILIAGIFCAEGIVHALRRKMARGEIAMRLAGFAGTFMASLVNPFGIRLLMGIIAEARLVGLAPVSSEWLPFVHFAQPLGWAVWTFLVLLVCTTIWWSRRNLSWARIVLFVFFAMLSLRSIRFVGPMVLVGMFVGMENTCSAHRVFRNVRAVERATTALAAVFLIFLFWATCFDRLYLWQAERKRFGFGVMTSEFPVDCSRFIQKQGLRGNFLNSWSTGGYLIWHNWPAIRIAEDGRTSPFPPVLSNQLRAVAAGDSRVLKCMEQAYPIDGAVVPWQYVRMSRLLSARHDWEPLFVGAHSAVWMKEASLAEQEKEHLALSVEKLRGFVVRDVETAFADEPWLSFPDFVYRRTLFFFTIGELDLAREQMDVLKSFAPDHNLLEELQKLVPVKKIENGLFAQ